MTAATEAKWTARIASWQAGEMTAEEFATEIGCAPATVRWWSTRVSRLGKPPLDRGTMCRWAEHAGMSLGWIVNAALEEARRTAFCLATDATGIAIQPEPSKSGARQACRKGHFFVTLADKDHVFFEYQPKHTSDAVSAMFRGFEGYI